MKNLLRIVIVYIVVALCCSVSPVLAFDLGHNIRELQKRVNHGVQCGDLTTQEAKRLNDELDRIRNDEARLTAGGRLTPHEQAQLKRELQILAENIYYDNHGSFRRIYE